MRSPARPSIACWPNRRSAMPSLASSGWSSITPKTLRARRIGIETEQQVGRRQMEEAQRVGLDDLAAMHDFAEASPRSAERVTPMIASHALAEVSRWLIGQMPQMRAVIDGIS